MLPYVSIEIYFDLQLKQGRYGKLQRSILPKKVAALFYLQTNAAEREDYPLSTETYVNTIRSIARSVILLSSSCDHSGWT